MMVQHRNYCSERLWTSTFLGSWLIDGQFEMRLQTMESDTTRDEKSVAVSPETGDVVVEWYPLLVLDGA